MDYSLATGVFCKDNRTAKEKTEDAIKQNKEALEHEEKKLKCINKLEAMGFDIEILKEVLR